MWRHQRLLRQPWQRPAKHRRALRYHCGSRMSRRAGRPARSVSKSEAESSASRLRCLDRSVFRVRQALRLPWAQCRSFAQARRCKWGRLPSLGYRAALPCPILAAERSCPRGCCREAPTCSPRPTTAGRSAIANGVSSGESLRTGHVAAFQFPRATLLAPVKHARVGSRTFGGLRRVPIRPAASRAVWCQRRGTPRLLPRINCVADENPPDSGQPAAGRRRWPSER
jgi:hypothetical protein